MHVKDRVGTRTSVITYTREQGDGVPSTVIDLRGKKVARLEWV